MTFALLRDSNDLHIYKDLYGENNDCFCDVWKCSDLNKNRLKARANARNIVGPNMLRAFAHHVVCCCVLLRLVGSCWMKFETGQTSEPTSANISIVSRSSKRGPTMLRSFAQHIQQCCAGARSLHATYPHKDMRTINQYGVGDGKRPRVLCILI